MFFQEPLSDSAVKLRIFVGRGFSHDIRLAPSFFRECMHDQTVSIRQRRNRSIAIRA